MTIEYNICGLSRSGNHPIIFWILHNFVESIVHIDHQIYADYKNTICYINNTNIYNGLYSYMFPTNKFEYSIKSYEDSMVILKNNIDTIVILRDILNLLCSRYKKFNKYGKDNIGPDNRYICNIHYLISVWKNHARFHNKILYNSWHMSKDYRDHTFQTLFSKENSRDRYDYVPNIGEGSSFDNNNNYLQRYEQVKLPKYMIDLIADDAELVTLNKDLFNIDLTLLK